MRASKTSTKRAAARHRREQHTSASFSSHKTFRFEPVSSSTTIALRVHGQGTRTNRESPAKYTKKDTSRQTTYRPGDRERLLNQRKKIHRVDATCAAPMQCQKENIVRPWAVRRSTVGMWELCAGFCPTPARCDGVVRSVALSLLVLFPACFISRCRGLTFTAAHVLVRALVDGPSSQPTDTVDHHTVVWSMLSCPLRPGHHRMCVVAKRLGCLSWLARAAGRRHFSSASASRRSSLCSRTFAFLKPRSKYLAMVCPLT